MVLSGKPLRAAISLDRLISAVGFRRFRPRLHGRRSEGPKGGSGDQMALEVEGVVDGSMAAASAS